MDALRALSLKTEIEEWHAGHWSVLRLPERLGVETHYIDGGGRLLGMSFRDSIIINGDIIGTPMLVPVIAHECAHIMLGHQYVHPCIRCTTQSRGEQSAWQLAALLSIPVKAVEEFKDGDVMPMELADHYGVPVRFLALRYALASDTGDCALNVATVKAQTARWLRWLVEQANPMFSAA